MELNLQLMPRAERWRPNSAANIFGERHRQSPVVAGVHYDHVRSNAANEIFGQIWDLSLGNRYHDHFTCPSGFGDLSDLPSMYLATGGSQKCAHGRDNLPVAKQSKQQAGT